MNPKFKHGNKINTIMENEINGVVSKPSEYVLGIDLGTTNSSVAIYGSQGMDVINIPGEGLSMPSVVRFPNRQKGEDLQVGSLAKRYTITRPKEVFSSFKTLMASSEWALDPQVREKYTIEGEELDPTFMAMQVLIKIREAVQLHPIYGAEGTICRAVICVPAQSQSTYVNNVYKAADAAGFGTWDLETGNKLYDDKGRVIGVTILEEPTAAAIAYGLMDNFFGGTKNKTQKLLIYDFGGGTFDVTLLEVASKAGNLMPEFNLINKGGNAKLGGDNLDWVLVDLLALKLSKVTGFNILEGEDSLKTKAVLKAWAEEAKKEISGGAAEYEFEQAMDIQGQSFDFLEKITRTDFLNNIKPLIDSTIETMKEVVTESKIDFDDINRIVLVGGSSKGSWVFDAVKEKMERDPYVAPNVETFVAAGASYYGSDLIDIDAPGGGDINDILPMNYGIELEGGVFGPMLLKCEKFENDKISRTRHFTNANDSGHLSLVGWTNSKLLEVEQAGESISCTRSVQEIDKDGNRPFTWIGEFNVEIPRTPAGTLDIELTMTVYKDKSLELTGSIDGKPISAEEIKWKY